MSTVNIIPVTTPLQKGTIFNDNETSASLISAIYGSDSKSIDVTKQLSTLGFPLILGPQMKPNDFFGCDPCPGTAKKLILVIDYDKGKGRETIIIDEFDSKWKSPICIDPSYTLDVVLGGGLCNQIYMIVHACALAKELHRSLVFPFRMLSRRNITDSVCNYSQPIPEIDVEYSSLFDEIYFEKNINMRLSRVKAIEKIDDKKDEKIDIRYTYSNKINWPIISSLDIKKYHYSEHKHISALYPFLWYKPETKEHYDKAIHVINCIIPNNKLLSISKKMIENLRIRIGNQPYAVIHLRVEQDWVKTFPTDVITVEEFSTSIKILCKDIKNLYLMGGTNIDSFWKRLQTSMPDHILYRKEDLNIDEIKDLKFEESAVVDREIGISSPFFFGYEYSTMSLIIALQREYKGLPYNFYSAPRLERVNTNLNEPRFFFSGGKPLYAKI